MPAVFVITESSRLNNSVARYYRHTRGVVASCLVVTRKTVEDRPVVQTFHRIVDWITSESGGDPRRLNSAIAVIDLCDDNLRDLSNLNPLDSTLKQGAVVAMLVLAFPEIHWVFHTPYSATPGPGQAPLYAQAHFLTAENSLDVINKLHDELFCPLFDPTGLRSNIRRAMLKANVGDAKDLQVRELVAASLDEEAEYAYLNGYAAYRNGYRCHVVSSYAMMCRLFDKNADNTDVFLTFEDVFLRYPDLDSGDTRPHLSKIRTRDANLPKLKDVNRRVFVTVGHEKTRDNTRGKTAGKQSYLDDDSISYLNGEWMNGSTDRWFRAFCKPLTGIFSFGPDSSLAKVVPGWENDAIQKPKQDPSSTTTTLGQKLRKLCVPLARSNSNDGPSSSPEASHSSPGRLLAIADCLIQRAVRLLEDARRVPDALNGATLALEAKEYLVRRTPTTLLESLSLQHQLEVTAECMFCGIEYNLNVESRLAEIEKEVRDIGEWFNQEQRGKAVFSAEANIVSALVIKYREYNQFDQEQRCLTEARRLTRNLWCCTSGGRSKWWKWAPYYPFRWYYETLISKFRFFAAAMIFWFTVLACGFGWKTHAAKPDVAARSGKPLTMLGSPMPFRSGLVSNPGMTLIQEMEDTGGSSSGNSQAYKDPPAIQDEVGRPTEGVASAAISFLGVGAPPDNQSLLKHGRWMIWLPVFAALLGFVHLGIFASYLYTIISRR